ncbi:hypothetical protein VEE70_44270 (plasmid) [Escherichia coli]|nr:hypothetical protein VEE70_44270 [Escherichia coli]
MVTPPLITRLIYEFDKSPGKSRQGTVLLVETKSPVIVTTTGVEPTERKYDINVSLL